jgi:hypothetical protein
MKLKCLSKSVLIGVCCWATSASALCRLAPCGSPAPPTIIPASAIPLCGTHPCYNLTVQPSVPVSLPAKATPGWGSTPAQVQSLFAQNIYLNFQNNGSLDAAFTSMGDVEIARFSTELARNDASGYTYGIMEWAAARLSAANLHRLQAALDPSVFAIALAYMPAATLTQYNATAMYPTIPLSTYWNTLNPSAAAALPSSGDLWVYDLLLDEKTSSAGEATTVAIANVSRYANARVKNIVIDVIVVLGFALALYDSPTIQTWAQELGDWNFAQQMRWINGGPVQIMPFPNIGDIIPPTIDIPVPDLPPLDGEIPANGMCNYAGCLL